MVSGRSGTWPLPCHPTPPSLATSPLSPEKVPREEELFVRKSQRTAGIAVFRTLLWQDHPSVHCNLGHGVLQRQTNPSEKQLPCFQWNQLLFRYKFSLTILTVDCFVKRIPHIEQGSNNLRLETWCYQSKAFTSTHVMPGSCCWYHKMPKMLQTYPPWSGSGGVTSDVLFQRIECLSLNRGAF